MPEKEPTMKIRKATEQDEFSWLALRKLLWPDCPEARHALEIGQLVRSGGVVFVAEDSAQPVGFAEVSIRHDHVEGTSSAPVPYLEGWYVLPSRRHQGIGRMLIQTAVQWASEAGYSELASDAEADNEQSIRAHRSLGFRQAGRSVHFVRSLGRGDAPAR
jgi:aminoglycoside 6'-N-acetyltransferase I